MSSWRTLLLRIGDRCPEYGGTVDLKEHIDTCYGILWRELEHSGDDILRFFLECSEQLPHKIPLYGVLVGLLNLENEDFARQIVDITQTNLQDALDTGNCNRIRILMRFITALMCSKVLQPGSIVEVFETLLSSAATTVDEERGNPYWQPRADFYVTCILSCLPWGGAELSEQIPEEIERVLAGIEAYLSIRKHASMIGFVPFESNEESENGHPEKDSLEDLWERIQALSNKGWIVDSVPKPYLSFEAQLVAGKSHEFGPISCPEQPDRPSFLSSITCGKQRHEAELNYPQRIRRLNLFPASKAEQSMQPIDRFIVEEYLLDVLLFFNGCRKECASYMAGLPVPFRYEYLMAETIFSQLLFLPHPPFKPVYYTLVIIDLCKALPGAFPAVVAAAVRSLFERIADLDMECRTRLILWFSHHLANFQFIWPWDEWAYVLELPKWAPQRLFVHEVLEREVRLSYWDKIKQSIENAPALEDLLPPRGGTNYRYSSQEESAEHLLSSELRSMVRGKKTTQEINAWMEENIVLVHGPRVALEVVIQTFLDIGSKSFTHLITVLERYGQVISKLCPDEERQIQLIDEVSFFWKNNAQMTAIAIDRMMGYRLISNLAIVKWVFFPSNVDQFHTSDCPWEILRNAINKTYNRILDLRKEISSLVKSISSAENLTAKAKAELEAAESKLEIVDGEPVQAENPVRLKRLKSYANKAKEEETSLRESLEAKEALLTRAFGENEALFIMLYKKFAAVLMERLARVCPDGKLPVLKTSVNDNMTLDPEEPLAMDVDKENGTSVRSQLNGQNASEGYHVEEEEQWCRTTLGYVKAFSRQYASEIWLHIERLETEVFAEDLHPLLRKAIYGGLRRPIT